VRFSGGSVFFRWKWLKNVLFSGGSGWKTCVFQVEVVQVEMAEKCAFFYRMAIRDVPHWCWLEASMSLHFIVCECLAIWGCCGGLHPVM
jgi:hypothetical protein